ncbi:prolipoprotein diacylglyceryl transferase [Candidatus Dependentiae bacterium]|nr:prolipoprotein diacylglyceryl transferase [Candidatus Dependentiae bacterium]
MHPILLTLTLPFNIPVIGNVITVYTYGFFAALGFLSGYLLLLYRSKKYGIPQEISGDIAFYSSIAGIIGARLSYVIVNWDYFSDNLSEIYKIYNGGIIFYGGAITGLAAGILLSLMKKKNFFQMLDLAVPSLTLGHFFGRIGCYMYGCCHGSVCAAKSFICSVFPKGSPAYDRQVKLGLINNLDVHALPVIPTQLIEAVFLFILTFLLLIFDKKYKKYNGQLFVLYLLLYSLFRFIIEFFRGDYDTEFIFFSMITFSQIISLALFFTAIVIFMTKGRKNI